MSKRAELRRAGRDIFGYRGKKAKRRRRIDPKQVAAFIHAEQLRRAELEQEEE